MNGTLPLIIALTRYPASDGCGRELLSWVYGIPVRMIRLQGLLFSVLLILLLAYAPAYGQNRGRISGTQCILTTQTPTLTSLRDASGGSISWQKTTDANFVSGIITIGAAAGFQSYTDGTLPVGNTYYRRVLTPTAGGSPLYSDTIKISVYATGPLTKPTFTPALGTETEICQQKTSFNVFYSTTGSPDKYSIIWTPAAIAEGFQDVYNAALPASNFSVTVPSTVSAGTFSGTLVAVISSTGCTLSNESKIDVNALPVISVQPATTVQNICLSGTSTDLSITAATPGGTLTTTSVKWYRNVTNSNSGGTLVATHSAPPATDIYTPQTAVANALYYYAVVTNSKSCVRTSNVSGLITVNSIPTAPAASSNSPVCVGSSLNLSTGTLSGASYSWTGPNGFSSALQNPSIPTTSTAASGTYSLTVTVNGCTSTASSTAVTVKATPATPTAANSGPLCAGTPLQLTTGSVSGAAYAWAGPGGFSSALQNPSVTTTSTATSGTYSLTVTVNGCTSAASSTTVTVKAIPATPSAANGGAVCVGTLLQLTTASVSGATYAWTGPGGFSSALQSPSIPTTSTAASGTYSLTVTVNGCTSAVSTTAATVKPIPATPVVNMNGPLCLGSSLQLSTASVTDATYAWTGPNSFSASSQNPSIASVTTPAAGTYSLRVTVNNCTSAAGTALLTVNALPTATITATGATIFCNGGTVTLTAGGGSSYLWSTGSALAAISVTSSGTITVTATDANGCKANSLPITVIVNPLPDLVITHPGAVCAPGTVDLTATAVTAGSTAGATFTYFTDAATSIPFATPANTSVPGTYYIKASLPSGCSSSKPVTVVINNPPSLAIQNPTAVCAPQTVDLTLPAVTRGSDNGLTYAYFTNETLTEVLPNPAAVVNSGVYYIKALLPGSACAASLPVTVTIHPKPTGNLQTPAVNFICSGSSLQLDASDAFAYQWLLNQSPITGATSSVYQASSAGTYSVRFISQKGCVREATNTIRIDQLVKPVLRFQLNSRCASAPIDFANLSTYTNSGGINWQWDFGDGALANSFSPSHTYTEGGNYTVSLTANNQSCPSFTETISIPVYVDSARVPVRYPTVRAVAGKTFSLTARSLGALYRWQPATGLNSSSVQSPMATLDNDAEYTVTITNSARCTTTDTVAVKIVFDGNVFVGNGFTPNGDGINDRCYPMLSGVRSLVYFKIYNRWGNLVFQTNDASPQRGWDGKYNGRLQPVGTYTWVAEAIDGKGNIIKRNGNVLLIN